MVEGNGLENRRARKGTAGSNPVLSATFLYNYIVLPHGEVPEWTIGAAC